MSSRSTRETQSDVWGEQQWSDWQLAITPMDTVDAAGSKRKPHHPGVRRDVDVPTEKGVYEWAIRSPGGRKKVVVYAGRAKGEQCNLNRRTKQYMWDGSHHPGSINDALKRGFDVFVRFRPCRSAEQAVDLEARLLRKFDYAWNKMDNGNATRDPVMPRSSDPYDSFVHVNLTGDNAGGPDLRYKEHKDKVKVKSKEIP